jgi:hypothetical protein
VIGCDSSHLMSEQVRRDLEWALSSVAVYEVWEQELERHDLVEYVTIA